MHKYNIEIMRVLHVRCLFVYLYDILRILR